jgi:hypothetical protein
MILPARMRHKIRVEQRADVKVPGRCWTWNGAVTSRGYGSCSHSGRVWSTHRLAYELLIAAIPEGLQIDHLCKNKLCCNPRHLEPVTAKVNCERTEAAQKLRCINGHPLVEPNLVIKRRANGLTIRNCRVCALDHGRRKRAATRGNRPDADRRRVAILAAAEEALLVAHGATT